MKFLLSSFFVLASCISLWGQCEELIYDQVDEFDSTRVVTAPSVNIGYMVPSNFQTIEGFKMVEEAKAIFGFTRQDSVNSFFIILAVAEREYLSTEVGDNVLLKLVIEDYEEVVGFYTVPDKGVFDSETNMRIYHHSCIVPLDAFYRMASAKIEKIRVYYKDTKRTITLTSQQQAAVQQAVRCVGEAAKVYPVRP
ncbi:MAG: hypothetical protein AAF798_02060 [Bacteroidota bacterium]